MNKGRIRSAVAPVIKFEPHQRHQPAGYGGAHIAAVNNANGLSQGHETGIDKADDGHGHGTGRLDNGRDQGPRQDAPHRCLRPLLQDASKGGSGGGFEAFGHEMHAEKK